MRERRRARQPPRHQVPRLGDPAPRVGAIGWTCDHALLSSEFPLSALADQWPLGSHGRPTTRSSAAGFRRDRRVARGSRSPSDLVPPGLSSAPPCRVHLSATRLSMKLYSWKGLPFSSRTTFIGSAQTQPSALPCSSTRLSTAYGCVLTSHSRKPLLPGGQELPAAEAVAGVTTQMNVVAARQVSSLFMSGSSVGRGYRLHRSPAWRVSPNVLRRGSGWHPKVVLRFCVPTPEGASGEAGVSSGAPE